MIRPATADDARALAELEVRAWRWAYVDFIAEEEMITVAERVERWEGRGVDGAFVAELEERVVGVVQVDDDGLLRGLNVEPAAQGAGVGAALHDFALDELARRGVRDATLWVFEANGHARGFYERRGWVADGATDVAAEAPELRYRKNLGPMTQTPTIRPVTARDVHAIAELQVRAWRHEHDGFVDEAHMPTLEDRITLWNGVRPGETWLAEDPASGRIVGVVGVHDGEVGVLHVDPDLLDEDGADGTDVDGLLLGHAEDALRDAGHSSILLWTFAENHHNRALYARHGWTPDGAQQETLPGVVEVRYRREL